MDVFLRRFMLRNGFVEHTPYESYSHECGLEVMCDEHEWGIDHNKDGWSEGGSLNDTNTMIKIIQEELAKYPS